VVVGLCRVEIVLPGNDSLKAKRRILRSLIDRTRRRYNVSIAEMDGQDNWQRCALAIACVGNSRRHVDRVLQEVMRWLEANLPGQVWYRETEIL